MGALGDWEKEGYTFSVERFYNLVNGKKNFIIGAVTVRAFCKSGKEVGYAHFIPKDEKKIFVHLVEVYPGHKRKGIATEMYRIAVKATGKDLIPSPYEQSRGARRLWEHSGKWQK